jgi:hypothetical protein
MTVRLTLIFVALVAALTANSCVDDVDCDALTREAFDALDEVIRSAQGPCTNDSDCSLVGHSSACHDSCSRVALASSLDAITQTRAAINTERCGAFSSGSCTLIHPPCDAPGTAVCRNGSCSESY